MADNEQRLKNALLDWQNELNYCESILKNNNASDVEKDRARARIKEAKDWINKIKAAR